MGSGRVRIESDGTDRFAAGALHREAVRHRETPRGSRELRRRRAPVAHRMNVACPGAMRFTIEQIFLASPQRPRAAEPPEYHLVEASDVDGALADFLAASSATLVGTVQKYPGFQAVATARTDDAVFTVHLLPGSDVFRKHS